MSVPGEPPLFAVVWERLIAAVPPWRNTGEDASTGPVTSNTRTDQRAAVLVVFVSVIANLTFYFQSTNLFRTVAMLALFFFGLILMARGVRDTGAAIVGADD